jgi:hypothetical protein
MFMRPHFTTALGRYKLFGINKLKFFSVFVVFGRNELNLKQNVVVLSIFRKKQGQLLLL